MGLGIGSVLCGAVSALPAVILGHLTLAEIRRHRTGEANKPIVIAGLILGYLGLFATIAVLVVFAGVVLTGVANAPNTGICQNNLKQMGIVLKMYSNESEGKYFPALSSEPGNLMMTGDAVYPEYLTELQVLICPSDPEDADLEPQEVRDYSYWYLGYAVSNQTELVAFHDAYLKVVEKGGEFVDDIQVPDGTGTAGADRIMRLGAEFEAFIRTTDPNPPVTLSDVPLMIERVASKSEAPHPPDGGNVLFLDGHVEFIRWGEWPYTEEAVALLNEMDRLDKVTPNE